MGKRREKETKKNRGQRACCDGKEGLRRGPWSLEEDKILVDFITANGHGTWRNLPKLAGLLRCGKSCRLRWVNYLQPGIKRDPFSTEEEDTIIHLHSTLGNKWAAIASRLPGRTDNDIKNLWNTNLKKRLVKTGDCASNRKSKKSKALILRNDLSSDGDGSSGAGGSEDDGSHGVESRTSSAPVKLFHWVQGPSDEGGGALNCENEAEDEVVTLCGDLRCDDDYGDDEIMGLLLDFPDESGGVGFLQGTDVGGVSA